NEFRLRFGEEIPYPEFWGDYRISPTSFEFWQGRPSRLHDRICYEKEGSTWNVFRLYP
ncbi:MAG: pyridoxamine 5'-phosphate oxidase, partial [Acidobacteria bacterium]